MAQSYIYSPFCFQLSVVGAAFLRTNKYSLYLFVKQTGSLKGTPKAEVDEQSLKLRSASWSDMKTGVRFMQYIMDLKKAKISLTHLICSHYYH